MRINPIGNQPLLNAIRPAAESSPKTATSIAGAGGPSFGDVVKNAVEEVNSLQAGADDLARKLATGDVQDIHQVMLALDKASTAFGLTVQVRNKVVEAYQEIMRLQV